ncbi:hypothetical protein [Rhizobium sp. LjRoot254]|uniref:hypothetical protein n=1 Tax=Rhizobium sp. LjRoot254 TaxID=3342297 RepID=UPI003ED11700
MLFQDAHWKRELGQYRNDIASLRLDENCKAEDFFRADRPIYYSAFVVRKLVEDNAVTDPVAAKRIQVRASMAKPNPRYSFVSHKVGMNLKDYFDLDKSHQMGIKYSELSSEVMHANGFVWDITDPSNLLFNVYSYMNTKRRILWVSVAIWIEMLDDVISDEPQDWWTETDKHGNIVLHAK